MNRLISLVLLVALLRPVIGFAQEAETIDFGAVVEQMSAQCPYTDGNWTVTSIALAADTIAVEIEAPASISGFLSAFTGKSMNVKRLWVDHIKGYGEDWVHLLELIAEAGQPSLMLTIKPRKSNDYASVFVTGKEIGTILAKH